MVLKISDGAVPICSIDGCIAKGILKSSVDEEIPALYIGKDTAKGCCDLLNHQNL